MLARYTLFIALYPIGVTSEIMIIYHSLPVLKQSKLHSVELPNWFNFAFSYYYFNLACPPCHQYSPLL